MQRPEDARMKSLSRSTGVVVALAVWLSANPAVSDVNWAGDSYEEVVKRAKSTNKYVFLDFYTVWCSPCKKMDKETYTNAKVSEFLNDMIAVKYDSEKGDGIALSAKYRVKAWPTVILLDPGGREIDRYLGFLGAEKLVKVMSEYMNGINTVAYYRQQVRQNPEDPQVWKQLGVKYVDAGLVPEAREALNKFSELAPNASANEKAEVLLKLAEVHYDGESYAEATKMFEEVIAEYGDSDYLDRATTRLARCYHKLGDTDKCVATYLTYVRRHPDDPKALNSFAWFCATRKVGLDEALPVAIKAVELSGRQPGFLDTLAELYYAREEYDKAIEIGREAADREPGDTYFENQLKKFKKAKANTG
jgi:thioredoxin 1